MTRATPPSVRYEGLDALRAGSMLLGLAYHATFAYVPDIGPYYAVVDPSASPFFNSLGGALHAFRMQVFFALAGFFSHLLLEKRGTGGFLRDRAKRLLVPFVAALPLTWVTDAATRQLSWSRGLMDPSYPPGTAVRWIPMHLWFLEYLFLFCAAAAVLGRLELPRARRWLTWALGHPEVLLLLAAPTGAGLVYFGELRPARSFIPELGSVVTMGAFYAFGFALYPVRDAMGTLSRRGGLFVAAGLALAAWIFTRHVQWEPLGRGLAGLVAWLVTLGGLGLAFRASAVSRPLVRELVDASYWIYLVHYPLVTLFQVLVAGLPAGAGLKFLLVVGGTFAVAWGTWLIVRRGPLQAYLGARRPAAGAATVGLQTTAAPDA